MFSNVFCDFGPEFEVVDSTGEEPKEFFIWSITKVCLKIVNTIHVYGRLDTYDSVWLPS